jgi:hypothetical protein
VHDTFEGFASLAFRNRALLTQEAFSDVLTQGKSVIRIAEKLDELFFNDGTDQLPQLICGHIGDGFTHDDYYFAELDRADFGVPILFFLQGK